MPDPGREASDPARTRNQPIVARCVEWLLRRDALRRATDTPALDAGQRLRFENARSCARAAEFMTPDDVPRHSGNAPGVRAEDGSGEANASLPALALYREAVFWALASRHDTDVASLSLTGLFESEREEASRAAGGLDELSTIELALNRAAMEDRGASREGAATLRRIRAFVRALLSDLGFRANPVAHVKEQRFRRVLMTVGTLLAFGVGVLLTAKWVHELRRPNLAAHAAWTASSGYGDCRASGVGEAPQMENVFFHTNEESSPWIEFDLGRLAPIEEVVVENRESSEERAVPLVLETSTDDSSWERVAQRTETFETFSFRFRRKTARYVRLRVEKQTYFHLASVAIY